ncbi:NAD(P)H-binding protein [Sphingomonas sp. PB2P19]|uniref:NAD(P)H-binding protein n=1 Tax=Sphingomonas rhamnosi TaxID=3096156 RepID=UPI002FC604E2
MLIITGATGQLGKRIVANLLRRVPVQRIGVSVRSPDRATDLAAQGVRVRQGDYDRPESLRHAWEGAGQVLLISSNAAAYGGDPIAQHANAIAVASDLGVERIFYTSQISASPTSLFPPGRDHAATEALLAGSGIAWTALRHGFYAQSLLAMQAEGLANGRITAPADGPVAWTTHDDLAAADAALLAGDQVIDGPTPPLTGPEALNLAEIARLASEVREMPVALTLISLENLDLRARENGVPAGARAVMLGYFRAAEAGEFAAVDPALTAILGHRPTGMREFLATHLPGAKPR